MIAVTTRQSLKNRFERNEVTEQSPPNPQGLLRFARKTQLFLKGILNNNLRVLGVLRGYKSITANDFDLSDYFCIL